MNDPLNLINLSHGKIISSIKLDDSLAEGNGGLVICFNDGTRLVLLNDTNSCCESRFIDCDDDLSAFVGAEFLTLGDPSYNYGSSDYDDCNEECFMQIFTSLGEFTLTAYNRHNGYYGGIWLRVTD